MTVHVEAPEVTVVLRKGRLSNTGTDSSCLELWHPSTHPYHFVGSGRHGVFSCAYAIKRVRTNP